MRGDRPDSLASLARWLSLVGVAACGSPATSRAPQTPSSSTPAADPKYALAHGSLDPMQLGNAQLVAAIDHHTWLNRYGRAWVSTGDPLRHDDQQQLDDHALVSVIGQTHERLRVVSQYDGANVALWIERGDVAPTVATTTQLTDEHGHADASHGVWLTSGVDVDARPLAAGRRELVVRDGQLAIHGWVDASTIDDVWVGANPREATPAPQQQHLAAHVVIREAPSAAARELAEIRDDVGVVVLARQGDWQEIDLVLHGIRIRGFVPAASVASGDGGVTGSVSAGSTYGLSDTDRLDVPPGACLFDRPDGHVVGVNVAQLTRYAFDVMTEWPSVYVDTPWGLTTLSVHVDAHGFASCGTGDAAR